MKYSLMKKHKQHKINFTGRKTLTIKASLPNIFNILDDYDMQINRGWSNRIIMLAIKLWIENEAELS